MEDNVKIELSARDLEVAKKALRFFAANLDDYNDWLAESDGTDLPVPEDDVAKLCQILGA